MVTAPLLARGPRAVSDQLPTTRTGDAPRQAPERRREPRHPCPSEPLLRYVVRPGLEARWAHALDVSSRGIGFLAAEPLRPGAVLALQLQGGAPRTSLIRVARVAHCTQA